MKSFKIDLMSVKTLRWWRAQQNKIDMDPPYQRKGRLWSDTDKAYLIDSILNGFDVPKVYVADFTWKNTPLNRKQLPYAIIDGKQRFEAIFDFYDGRITLNENFEFVEDPSLNLAGLGYSDLQKSYPHVADTLDNYNLSVVSVVSETDAPIRELFLRLNRNKPLTGAEVRNAMAGPAPEVIRQVSEHEFFDEYVRFKTDRMQEHNAAAKLLMFEYHDNLRDTKKRNLDAFVETGKKQYRSRLEVAGRRVLDVLDQMTEIFLPKDYLLSSAGVVPVYFWFVRSRGEPDYQSLREFLVAFERARKVNREIVKSAPRSRKVDRDLVRFDQYNRNTNDSGSHQGRFEILKERFEMWLAEQS